ncbi:MAG: reverse transcriptase domain-containing protein [Bacteroidota bacterium]
MDGVFSVTHISRDKARSLKALVDAHNIDVLVLTETHERVAAKYSRDWILDTFEECFEWHHCPSIDSRRCGRGGVGCLVRRRVGESERLPRDAGDNTIVVKVTVSTTKEVLYVIGMYTPPSQRLDVEKLRAVFEVSDDLRSKGLVVVAGDFNRRLGERPIIIHDPITNNEMVCPRSSIDKTSQPVDARFLEIVQDHGLVAVNGLHSFGEASYTFESHLGCSVIDYAFVHWESLERVSGCFLIECETIGTDHHLVGVDVKCPGMQDEIVQVHESSPVLIPWKRTSDRSLLENYTNMVSPFLAEWVEEWDSKDSGEFSRELYQRLVQSMIDAMKITVGTRKTRVAHRRAVRWDPHVQQLKKSRRTAWISYRNASAETRPSLLEPYRQACWAVKQAVSKLKNEQERRAIERVESLKSRKPRAMWRALKSLGKWKRSNSNNSPTPIIDKESGQLVRDPQGIKALWAKYFHSLGTCTELSGGSEARRLQMEVEQKPEHILEASSESESVSDEQLNTVIQESEVSKAIHRLKSQKASAEDNIVDEMIRYGGDQMVPVLVRLLNFAFFTHCIPQDWEVGIIHPLFKKGARSDPSNYRGITVSSVLYKVLSILLNNRIVHWVESKRVLRDEQGGFRPGRGCPEKIFSLVEIIRYQRSMSMKTYCCFVDIQKAYDSVWRKGLWWKLWDVGIRGHMWFLLRAFYRMVQGKVKVKQELSSSFEIGSGVKQGCPLSPTLFSIFFDSISEELERVGVGVYIEQKRVCQLLYADDVVLLAENGEDLQALVDRIHIASEKWQLHVNIDKTETMVFRPKNVGLEELKLHIGSHAIRQVRQFKYLGVCLEDNLSWSSSKKNMEKQARSAVSRVASMGVSSGNLSVRASVMVWKCLVRSHLEYCAEVHGESSWKEAERIQYDMGRRILRCSRGAPEVAIRGELGWCTIKGRRDLARLRLWYKIIGPHNGKLIHHVYRASKERYLSHGKSNWCKYTHNLLKDLGLVAYWTVDNVALTLREWSSLVRAQIFKREDRLWRSELDRTPKLKVCKSVKSSLRLEKYLETLAPTFRKCLAKFRCSDHGLAIEAGRRAAVPRGERLCQQCDFEDVDEDEEHLMLECPAYMSLRESYVQSLLEAGWVVNQPQDIFPKVLESQDKTILDVTCNYIYCCLRARSRQLQRKCKLRNI